ncbi:MAG TPA: plasmid pRiA4b ORF-3 family protein, partial [Thermoanaerobaculia bacterium]|nr:plasmid pRiA4b ORF-3 family protein [Thermoanaerobaculia bacterium]
LIELLRDPGRPLERRAIAFVLLMQGEASELDRTMRSLGPKDPPRLVEAAAKWLEQFRDLDRAGGQPATRRARGRAGGRRSSRKRAIVRLKVTLRGIRPPIWRRIEVRDDVTFATLHQILQFAMGWTDTHLHRFEVEGETIAVPDPEWDEEIIDSKRVRLRDVIDRGVRRFLYEYDFGDDWRHDVAIEKTVDPEPRPPVARVVAGRRACPPEDCGGPYGYAAMIEALSDPAHEEHESWRGWGGIGGSPGTSRRRGRLRPPYPGPSRPGVGYRRRDAWDTAG